jgi:hypothetical protein
MTYTRQEILNQIDKLPKELQEAYFSVDIDNVIFKIGETNSLHVDQIGLLANQVGLVIVGLTKPQDFLGNLVSELGISRDEAGKITQDINEQVFLPIRDSLKKIHHVGNESPVDSLPTGNTGHQSTVELIKPESEQPKKEDVLRGIEEPESMPMGVRVVDSQIPEMPNTKPSIDPYKEPLK